MTTSVDAPSAAVAKMAEAWPMIDALVGGTGAMRAAGKAFLPQFPAEPDASYKARLSCATLFPAFSRTSEVLAAKPLSKAIKIEGLPAEFEPYLEDIDGEGSTLHAYASSLMLACLQYGLVGVLVDVPPAEGIRTKAEEDAAGIRPYLATYKASSILGWRHNRGELTQLRLLEDVTEEDGEFGEKCVRQVRVLTSGAWQVWRKVAVEGGREEWRVHDEGKTTLSRIPFVPFYGLKDGFCVGKSPLLDLGYSNVKHFQKQSDHDNIIHVASVPILFAKGLNAEDELVIGASSFTRTTSENADLKFVEHGGSAITAGRDSLKDLESQMVQIGAELIVQRPNLHTAAQTNAEGEGQKSILQRIVENFEESLEDVLELMGEWKGQKFDTEVTMFKDFNAVNLSDACVALLFNGIDKGVVSRETAFSGLQRRDIVPAEITWEDEKKRIEAEAPEPEEGAEDLVELEGEEKSEVEEEQRK